jgi:hypothetical protein
MLYMTMTYALWRSLIMILTHSESSVSIIIKFPHSAYVIVIYSIRIYLSSVRKLNCDTHTQWNLWIFVIDGRYILMLHMTMTYALWGNLNMILRHSEISEYFLIDDRYILIYSTRIYLCHLWQIFRDFTVCEYHN